MVKGRTQIIHSAASLSGVQSGEETGLSERLLFGVFISAAMAAYSAASKGLASLCSTFASKISLIHWKIN